MQPSPDKDVDEDAVEAAVELPGVKKIRSAPDKPHGLQRSQFVRSRTSAGPRTRRKSVPLPQNATSSTPPPPAVMSSSKSPSRADAAPIISAARASTPSPPPTSTYTPTNPPGRASTQITPTSTTQLQISRPVTRAQTVKSVVRRSISEHDPDDVDSDVRETCDVVDDQSWAQECPIADSQLSPSQDRSSACEDRKSFLSPASPSHGRKPLIVASRPLRNGKPPLRVNMTPTASPSSKVTSKRCVGTDVEPVERDLTVSGSSPRSTPISTSGKQPLLRRRNNYDSTRRDTIGTEDGSQSGGAYSGLTLNNSIARDEAMHRNQDLQQVVNSLKRKLATVEQELVEKNIENKALAYSFQETREKNKVLTMELKGLKEAGTDLSVITRPAPDGGRDSAGRDRFQRNKGGRRKYTLDVESRFRGPALLVAANIPFLCIRETQEFVLESTTPERNWTFRCEESVQGSGLLKIGDGWYAPSCPIEVALRREYFTPSYVDDVEILKLAVEMELSRTVWDNVYLEKDKEDILHACTFDKFLRERTRQSLSDAISARKRNAKDKLLEALGYTHLVSRLRLRTTLAHVEERDRQKREAFTRLRSENTDGVENMSFWRDSDITTMFYPGSSMTDEVMRPVEGDMFFRRNMSLMVLREFLGYDAFESKAECSIILLARLDAWVVTVVHCLNEPDGRGGKRQKKFTELFSRFLPLAMSQILSRVREALVHSHPQELQLDEHDSATLTGSIPSDDHRRATLIVRMATEKTYLAVTPTWINDNVTCHLGSVHDCYVGEASSSSTMFEPRSLTEHHSGMFGSADEE